MANLARIAVVPGLWTLLGCGASATSTYDAGHEPDAGHEAADSGPGLRLDAGSGGKEGSAEDAACATDHALATVSPAYLVFVMDRSDSMKADSKWPSCSSALDTFFSSKMDTNLSASLTFFPEPSKATGKASCDAADYGTPAVPMTLLPSGTFQTAIAATTFESGTPTLAALEGAASYAAAIQEAHATGKVIIVLATDGKPAGCTGNDVAAVAAEAAKALAAGVPTYVIGVGSATSNLDAIATAGGTTAFIVSTSDPAMTSSQFLAAVQSIQGSLGCEYPIPAPPHGKMLDPQKVNVELTASGKTRELPYSAKCAVADGWYYDDPAHPTEVILCPDACTQAQASGSDTVDVVFGCKTVGMPPK